MCIRDSQQGVADAVPHGVIDFLEPIEVDEHGGERRTLTLRLGERLLPTIMELAAIGHLRQGILARHVLSLIHI